MTKSELKAERDLLRAELINLWRVVESGDWSVAAGKNAKGWMSVEYDACEEACDRAEKVISKTGE